MRIEKAVYEKMNEMLTRGRESFPSIQERFPEMSDEFIFNVYLRKAHHDARSSLRKISSLKLRIDQLYHS